MDSEHAASTDPSPPDEPPDTSRNGPQVLLAVVAVVAAALAIGGWYAAAQAANRGDAWKRRAEDRGAVVDELEATLEGANAEVDAANAELEATNQSLADAQARIDELASQIAGTEDEREAAIVTVGQLEDLVRQAGLVATDLDTCATGAVEVVSLVNSLGDYDLDEVNDYVAEVQEVCGRALAENDGLQGAIAALDSTETDEQ